MTAKQFKAWRMAHHHSQLSLATALGVNVRQVIRWEMGSSPISKPVELALNSVPARKPEEVGRWPQAK